jgi:uncharacterized protein with von Willebrand factor type A (vWA) domain
MNGAAVAKDTVRDVAVVGLGQRELLFSASELAIAKHPSHHD